MLTFSWEECIYWAIRQAKRDPMHDPLYKPYSCYICGRKEDNLLDKVILVTIYDNDIKTICLDHENIVGPEIVDCTTGDPVKVPAQKGEAYIFIRNLIYSNVLKTLIVVRFVWFLGYYVTAWWIIIPYKKFLKRLERK